MDKVLGVLLQFKNGFQVQECLYSSNISKQLPHLKGHFPREDS